MNDDDSRAPFEFSREELRHWAHTLHQVEDTLDLSLIEGRAKQLLFQALNDRTMTAFVGSGLSAAYGRLSWSDWQDQQLKVTEGLATAFLKLVAAAITEIALRTSEVETLKEAGEPEEGPKVPSEANRRKVWRWLIHRRQVLLHAKEEVTLLKRVFDRATSGQDSEYPGGEALTIKFEIAQKLHDLVLNKRDLFLPQTSSEEGLRIAHTLYWGTMVDPQNGAPIEALKTVGNLLVPDMAKKLPNKVRGSDLAKFYKIYADLADRPEGKMSFETLAKVLLVDECAHAEKLLLSGLRLEREAGRQHPENFEESIVKLRDDLDVISDVNLKRDIAGIRQDPERYRVLQFFRVERLANLLKDKTDKHFPEIWGDLMQAIGAELAKLGDGKRVFLTPTSRFLVEMVLTLADKPLDVADILGDKFISERPKNLTRADFTSRQSIIDPHFDPLDSTVHKLGISRYLTTNYDFEIERFYQDLGFRRIEHQTPSGEASPANWLGRFDREDYRVNGMGNALRDLSFNADEASDLVTFAAAQDAPEAAVYHLHGRAARDEPLVITERNYMDMYLRNDPRRDMVDEGITMAFASTPLLFLGLGMGEADVLRPLRQFISDNDRSLGYTATVLLAANESLGARSKFASTLYLRYGVHSIFYGSGEVSLANSDEPQPLDWLHRISNLVQALKAHAESRREVLLSHCTRNSEENEPIFEGTIKEFEQIIQIEGGVFGKLTAETYLNGKGGLNDAVGKIGEDLIVVSGRSTDALAFLYGKVAVSKDEILKGAVLVPCKFTSSRPGLTQTARRARKRHRRSKTDGTPYTKPYLDILSGIVRMTLCDLNDGVLGRNVPEYLRDLSGRIVALNGLYGALLTGCFNAALLQLEKEQRDWLTDWQTSPRCRFPRLEEQGYLPASPDNKLFLPRIFVRHRVRNTITDLSHATKVAEHELVQCFGQSEAQLVPEKNELARERTNIRSFDTFILAVANQSARMLTLLNTTKPKDKDDQPVKFARGRRFYTVAARIGMGKGTFFSAFATPLGLSSYLRAAHPIDLQNTDDNNEEVLFVGAIFLNFSFSTEIASVYDMLQETLLDLVAHLRATHHFLNLSADDLQVLLKKLEVSTGVKRAVCELRKKDQVKLRVFLSRRMEDSEAYEVVKEKAKQEKRTFIRSQRGVSRLTQLRNLMQAFKEISDTYAKEDPNDPGKNRVTPRVLICMGACELLFDRNQRAKNKEIEKTLRYLTSCEASSLPIDIVAIGADDMLGAPWTIKGGKPDPAQPAHRQFSLQHRLIHREAVSARGRDVISQRCERTRIKVPALELKLAGADDIPTSNNVNFVYFSRLLDPMRMLVDNFLPLACALLGKWRKEQGQTCDIAPDALSNAHLQYRTSSAAKWAQTDVPDVEGVKQSGDGLSDLRSNRDQAVLAAFSSKIEELSEELKECDDTKSYPATQPKDVLFERYKLPQSLRDLKDWRGIRTTLSANRYCLTMLLAAAQEIVLNESNWEVAAAKAEEFIFKTEAQVKSMSDLEGEPIVLRAAMGVHRHYHEIGCAWRDVELHDHLLRNIAVINSPVSAGVLVRLPEIRNYFDSLGEVVTSDISRRRTVAVALNQLGERGLVFRLAPNFSLIQSNPEDTSWPAKRDYRYALHRIVQQFGVSHLGSRTFEAVRTNDFAPSRYASLPSDVPRLNHESYRFLRSLLLGLSQYPDVTQKHPDDPVWLFASANEETRVQALRAALTMIRSVFSIAVVSRFEDYKNYPGEMETRRRGYFETYKVRLRWVVRKAWELCGADDDYPGGKMKFAALYRDEVVWLYNEIGITCLVQGNLVEAVSYLRQALTLNGKIDGSSDSGPQTSIISLNLAIVQIERGRIDKARERLKAIRDREQEIKADVYHLAQGYLGLVAHLTGRRSRAGALMKEAIAYFQRRGDMRALAIFRGHLGRLVPERDYEHAHRILRDALENAEAGGHEDVRYRTLIAQVRLARLRAPDQPNTKDLALLGEIEEYARNMGIPALACDAAHERALILVAAGDTATAGRGLVRAMAIARRKQMNLRLNSMLSTYAQVLWMRGQHLAARRLCYASLDMAKQSKYALEEDRILRILRQWTGERA